MTPGSRNTSICHQRMWFILGLMGVDVSLHIHTDVWWKWRTLIIRAEWFRILITSSLYTGCFLSGRSWTDFPADGDRVAHWRDPPHMRNHTFYYVMLPGSSPCEIHPCISSPWLPSVHEIKAANALFYHFYCAVVHVFVVTRAAVPYWSNGPSFNAFKWKKKRKRNVLMHSAAHGYEGIKLRSVTSLEADTSK